MRTLIITGLLAIASAGTIYAAPASDAAIKKQMIAESQANYPGNCPCPYNSDRAGRSCGRRSAYSKPGGYSPLCFEQDITSEMVKEYKEQKR